MINGVNAAERRAFQACDLPTRADYPQGNWAVENMLSSREVALQTLQTRLSGA